MRQNKTMASTHTQEPNSATAYHPTETEQLLLNEMQADFPLISRPFAGLAERVGTGEEEVLASVARLKEARLVRQISAIFDSRRLGYRSSLVAMKFRPEDLEAGAEVINQHPGVSHNYKRNHAYNLWFTIAVPPGRTVEDEVNALAERARPEQTWLLPTIKLFKIGVNLDVTGHSDVTAREDEEDSIGLRSARQWSSEAEPLDLSPQHLTAIRLLQRDLPLVPCPFEALASEADYGEERLLELAEELLRTKRMRRFAAVLHHRRAGFRANAMGVWVVPEERIEEIGQQMASFKAVSHCYQRPTYPDWPYSVFTMIHGRHSDDCVAVTRAISEATGITEYDLLYSTKEYKKTRVRYFVDDDDFDVRSLPVRA